MKIVRLYRTSLPRLLIVSLCLAAFSCSMIQGDRKVKPDPVNTLTKEEKKEGWILLFDGRSLDLWRGIGAEGIPEGQWTIEDQAIKKISHTQVPRQADGQPVSGGDLITVDTFGDFELRWEWKLNEKGNSGIKYNISEELSMSVPPVRAALGWEYQMIDDESFDTRLAPEESAGALYDMIAPRNKVLHPVGSYNSSRIIVKGNHGEHWLNGQKVLEYEMGSVRFDSLFRLSKYRNIPGFRDRKDGHIALQDHAEESWIRNIKIRRLIPAD